MVCLAVAIIHTVLPDIELPANLIPALLFAFLILAWFSLRRIPNWLRSLRSSSWPTVTATIETGDVIAVRSAGLLKDTAEYANAEIGYSYVVNGERYSGYWTKQFFDEQAAWEFVGSWRGRSVTIRCRESEPQESAFRLRDQNSAQTANQIKTV